MPKICDMDGVREYGEGDTVELWLDNESGRLTIRARNEGGYGLTDVDLWDIIKIRIQSWSGEWDGAG